MSKGISLQIYKYTNYLNSAPHGILPFRKSPTALNEMKNIGGGSFTVSRSDPKVLADPELLKGRNMCKVVVEGKPVGAFLLGDKESIIVGQGERAEISWKLAGSGLKQWFDDARVEPFGGIKQGSGTTRYFNFASEQGSWYNESAWVNPVVFSTVGSQSHYPIPEKWPEGAKNAQWIWGSPFVNPMPFGNVYFRYTLTVPADGRYAIYTAVDDVFQLYIDGQQIAKSSEKSTSWREASRIEVDLLAGEHVIAYLAYNLNAPGYNGPAALAMAISRITGVDTEAFVGVSQLSGWKVLPYPAQAPGWSPGEILNDLLDEAVARGVQFPTFLTRTFTNTLDSNGVAWPASLYGEWSFSVGESLLSVVNKLEEACVDIWIDPDSLELNMVPLRGVDRTQFLTNGVGEVISSPIEFKLGKHVRQASTQSKAKIKNDLLLKTLEGWLQTEDDDSVGIYGKLESTLDTNAPSTLAETIAELIFNQRAKEEEGATYDLIFDQYVPFEDFDIGDWVLAPNDQGESVPRRVMSISVTEDNSGEVLYTIEFDTIFRDNEDRMNRVLDKLGGGGVGSSYSNVAGSTPGVGQPIVIGPPSTPAILRPMAPTGLAVTSNTGYWTPDGTRVSTEVVLDWNNVTQNTDLSPTTPTYYEVWGWRNGDDNFINFGLITTSTITMRSLVPGDEWVWQVRALNDDGTPSAWSTTVSATMAVPNEPLPAPDAPTLSSELGLLVVAWDGQLNNAAPAPQFRYVYVEVGTTATGPWVKRGTVLTTSGQVSIPGETVGEERWVRLIAVDGIGLESDPSTVSGPITIVGVDLGELAADIEEAIEAATEAGLAAREQSNMLSDYSFELNTNEFWTLGTGVTNVTTDPRTGLRHLSLPATTVAREGFRYNRIMPCQPGDNFYFRAYMKPQMVVPDDGLVIQVMYGVDPSLGTIEDLAGSGDIAPGQYTSVTGNWTVPEGANFFTTRVWIADTNNTSVYFVDDYRILKMTGEAELVVGSVTADRIAADSITVEHLQASSVSTEKIQSLSITAEKLAVASVTAEKIAADTIEANHIISGAIQTNHLAPAVGQELNIAGNVTIVSTQDRITGVEDTLVGTQSNLDEMQTYYSFGPTGAVVSSPGSIFATAIRNDRIEMLENGNVVSYWNSGTLYVNQLEVSRIAMGNHQLEKFEDGTIVRAI